MEHNEFMKRWNAKGRREAEEKRRSGKWAVENFPTRTQMTRSEVTAIGGKFYGNDWRKPPTWFVPFASHEPVMTLKKDGTWGARGF